MNSKRNSCEPQMYKRYKFLRRNVNLDRNEDNVIQKICAKRLYLKKMIQKAQPFSDYNEIGYRRFKNIKLFKTLRIVQIREFSGFLIFESLKACKNLKSFSIDSSCQFMRAPDFKKLPSSIQTIHLQLAPSDLLSNRKLHQIAKSIRRFPRLQSFYEDYSFLDADRINIQQEFQILSRSASRLKNIENIGYEIESLQNPNFQKAMRRGIKYPALTQLKICLKVNKLPFYPWIRLYVDEENSHDEEELSLYENMTQNQQSLLKVLQEEIQKLDEKEKRKISHDGSSASSESEEEKMSNTADDEDNEEDEMDSKEEIEIRPSRKVIRKRFGYGAQEDEMSIFIKSMKWLKFSKED